MVSKSVVKQWAWGSLLGVASLLAACGGGGSVTTVLPPPTNASGTVAGTVLNAETGAAVAGASVNTGNQSVTSGTGGSFTLTSVAPATRVLLRISAPNYADHIQVIQVSANQTTRVATQLVPVGKSQQVTIGTADVVAVPNSPGMVTLPANTFAGSGMVTVNVTPINTSVNPGLLPGDFSNSSSGAPIETFGAITVSVNDAAGNAVPVVGLITIRIPASSRSGALVSPLPLYYLDPTTGRWVLTTFIATLDATSTYYEGQVDKAGTWSVNQPFQTVNVAGCVKDELGALVPGVRVLADGVDYTGITSATTGIDGQFSVAIKQSATAVITARSGGKTSNSRAVGPSANNIDTSSECLVLTDQAQNVTIRLTWGEAPLDVDGHLVTPSGAHIYFQSLGILAATPWAHLDVDDITSYGPEVITVRKLMVGTYRYHVNNFSGTFGPGITESPTRVELNVGGLTSAYTPPPGEGAAPWWSVFNLVVDAQCNVTVVPVNTWSLTQPTISVNAEQLCTPP